MTYQAVDLRAPRPPPSRWRPHERLYGGLLLRLARWINLHVFLVFKRELVAPDAEAALPPGYTFRAITAAELLDAARDSTLEISRERVRIAEAQGDLFYGVFHGDRLVAYRWYALSGTTPIEDGLVIRYASHGRAYGYRAFTHPRHRGNRVHLHSTRLSDAELRARGCTHAIGYIAAENFASLRSNSRQRDSRRIGVIVALRLGRVRLILRSAGVARYGITVRARS